MPPYIFAVLCKIHFFNYEMNSKNVFLSHESLSDLNVSVQDNKNQKNIYMIKISNKSIGFNRFPRVHIPISCGNNTILVLLSLTYLFIN